MLLDLFAGSQPRWPMDTYSFDFKQGVCSASGTHLFAFSNHSALRSAARTLRLKAYRLYQLHSAVICCIFASCRIRFFDPAVARAGE